jgi:hypothetical protein
VTCSLPVSGQTSRSSWERPDRTVGRTPPVSALHDPSTLEQLAAHYREGGWPAEVDGDAFTAPFSAPSAGPPPWYLYRFTLHTAIGVATAEPNGATRWRFRR